MAAKLSRILLQTPARFTNLSTSVFLSGRSILNGGLPGSFAGVRGLFILHKRNEDDFLTRKGPLMPTESSHRWRPISRNISTDSSTSTEFPLSNDENNTVNVCKKLTLDDIVSQWPEVKPAWAGYRRNHKGQIPPKRTRLRCTTIDKQLLTQNPCPVCRIRVEKNYEISSKDVSFLTQFMSPHTGEILHTGKTGVCRQQQKKLLHAIEEAQDKGYLPFTISGPRDPPKPWRAAGVVSNNIRNKTG
ncbi:predicted protein [Nematostella vectensis]|uniref:Small ribosomal subunit protein mS40 n=1 Tax=Nematostella vectensis TaxID=45351 RepID=A7RW82_NEMVE|nr:uncharacterized protein LOC5516197 isoform X2 [Nematostella vectensis]EDO44265.1 predicted protein [Nematostella vectensis]|eukprot:XP_001636328.1 predicted protein [Nematostella vectensis]